MKVTFYIVWEAFRTYNHKDTVSHGIHFTFYFFTFTVKNETNMSKQKHVRVDFEIT